MKVFNTIFIFVLLLLFISCNINNNNKEVTNQTTSELNLLDGEWTDQTGSMSFGVYTREDTNIIHAFDTTIIKYKKLNDTLYQIIYPEKLLLTNVEIESFYDKENIIGKGVLLHEWISIDKFWSYDFNSKNEEIIFGADDLKIKKISRNKIIIIFPKESFWIVKKDGDNIEIYNKNNKYRKNIYTPVIGG